jgi:aminocarboxymuconate-semialdehyde decarboxylase
VTGLPSVIDVHTHVVPSVLPELDDVWWPQADTRTGDVRTLVFRGGNRRKIDVVATDMPARLADMAGIGVGAQVLSVMPALSADLLHSDEAAAVAAEHVNDFLEQCVLDGGGQFQAFATLPAGADRCIAELEQRLAATAFAGVQLTTTGVSRLVETGLWRDVADRVAAADGWIFVHPHDESVAAAWNLERRLAISGIAMTAHTAMTALALMAQLHADPKPPRVLLAHGGGALPYNLARLDELWEKTPARTELPERPSEVARRLFYVDSAVHGTSSLQLAIESMPQDRVLFGSDYPFAIQLEPQDMDAVQLSPDRRERLMWRNAVECGLGTGCISGPRQRVER